MIGIDMELPKSCSSCEITEYYCHICPIIGKSKVDYKENRHPDCPLVDLGKEDMFRQEIAGCLARGYCSYENCNKELDANLIKAMVDEIFKLQTIKSLVGDER